MTIWEKSILEIAFQDQTRTHEKVECRVAIDDQSIVVSFELDGRAVVYQGENVGTGNFVLACPETAGKASLHVVRDGEVLEGYWIVSGEKGYWRIKLKS